MICVSKEGIGRGEEVLRGMILNGEMGNGGGR
jgi:hypothetical protein